MARAPFDSKAQSSLQSGQFATTRWSVVLSAGAGEAEKARLALGTLCETYWYPIYVYVRRQTDADTAADLTQEFLTRLLERNELRGADPQRGRFRAFLLTALKHFISDQRDRQRAQKRGGGKPLISLSARDPESRYQAEPADAHTPESIFERRWALTVLENALRTLENDFIRQGKRELFAKLKPYLTGSGQAAYAQLGAELKMTEAAIKVAIHRVRKRYRESLRAEVAQTLAGTDGPAPTIEEIEDEIRCLFAALGS